MEILTRFQLNFLLLLVTWWGWEGDRGVQKKRTDFINHCSKLFGLVWLLLPFLLSLSVWKPFLLLHDFFFKKFLHLKFKSQQSAGCLLQPCLFSRPLERVPDGIVLKPVFLL